MVTSIPSKPEMFVQGIHSKPEIPLQNIQGFMMLPKQVKPEAPKPCLPLHSSLQQYVKLFYKYTRYYVLNLNTNNNTGNIRKQAIGYSMLLKSKQRAKVKAKGCAEGHHCRKFNHESKSSSHIVLSCLHIDSYVMNTLDYIYKLRSVIVREENFTTNKLKWFDTQLRETFFGLERYHSH